MDLISLRKQKCAEALLSLIRLHFNKKQLSLLTKQPSYQQIRAFPLSLLAWTRNPYKFVYQFNRMFNQQLI